MLNSEPSNIYIVLHNDPLTFSNNITVNQHRPFVDDTEIILDDYLSRAFINKSLSSPNIGYYQYLMAKTVEYSRTLPDVPFIILGTIYDSIKYRAISNMSNIWNDNDGAIEQCVKSVCSWNTVNLFPQEIFNLLLYNEESEGAELTKNDRVFINRFNDMLLSFYHSTGLANVENDKEE